MDYRVKEAGDEQWGCPFSGGRIVRTIGRETGTNCLSNVQRLSLLRR